MSLRSCFRKHNIHRTLLNAWRTAAPMLSNAIGKVEIERLRETHSTGLRAGNNFTVERQVEPLVLDSEISGLADKHAFLKLGTLHQSGGQVKVQTGDCAV